MTDTIVKRGAELLSAIEDPSVPYMLSLNVRLNIVILTLKKQRPDALSFDAFSLEKPTHAEYPKHPRWQSNRVLLRDLPDTSVPFTVKTTKSYAFHRLDQSWKLGWLAPEHP